VEALVSRPVTTVALGFEDLALSEEILSLFDRNPAFRVVGAVADDSALSRLARDAHPSALIGSPAVLSRADGNGAIRLAVAQQESVAGLREAIRAGAAGFYLWPEDRTRLAGDASRLVRRREEAARPHGQVVAVYGPRGGAGATFLATHLAAAAARLEVSACLVECDPFFADLSAALGVAAAGDDVRTVGDLVPVLDEVSAEHLEDVLFRHPAGFAALLGPQDVAVAEAIRPDHLTAVIGALAGSFGLVVLHPSRSMDELARTALGTADRILLVVSLDVIGLRDARRALSFLEGLGIGDRCEVVVNRAARGDVVTSDAERVLGLPVAAEMRVDRTVGRAQDRGELVFGRASRTSRALVRLARRLTEVAA
jgi:pilus assembly protein CpaE